MNDSQFTSPCCDDKDLKDRMADSSSKPTRNSMTYVTVAFTGLQVAAIAKAVLFFYCGYYYCGEYIPVPASVDLVTKLTFTVRCIVPALFPMMIFNAMVRVKRLEFGAEDPLAGRDHFLQLEKNVLTNTMEQFAVFCICAVALATFIDSPGQMKLIPLYTAAFIIGRVLFRIGYGFRSNTVYRGFGMTINFGSNYCILAYIVYLMCTKGFMLGLMQDTTINGGGSMEDVFEGRVEL